MRSCCATFAWTLQLGLVGVWHPWSRVCNKQITEHGCMEDFQAKQNVFGHSPKTTSQPTWRLSKRNAACHPSKLLGKYFVYYMCIKVAVHINNSAVKLVYCRIVKNRLWMSKRVRKHSLKIMCKKEVQIHSIIIYISIIIWSEWFRNISVFSS